MLENVKVVLVRGHCEIYVDGKFYSSCETSELKEELEEMKNNDNTRKIREYYV